jgi:hypothetical protein
MIFVRLILKYAFRIHLLGTLQVKLHFVTLMKLTELYKQGSQRNSKRFDI